MIIIIIIVIAVCSDVQREEGTGQTVPSVTQPQLHLEGGASARLLSKTDLRCPGLVCGSVVCSESIAIKEEFHVCFVTDAESGNILHIFSTLYIVIFL